MIMQGAWGEDSNRQKAKSTLNSKKGWDKKKAMENRAIIKQRGKGLLIPLHGKMLDNCKTCDERGAVNWNCRRAVACFFIH